MGFSRQEYWSGLTFLPPGNLPDPGIKPVSTALQVDSLLLRQPSLSLENKRVLRGTLGTNSLAQSLHNAFNMGTGREKERRT